MFGLNKKQAATAPDLKNNDLNRIHNNEMESLREEQKMEIKKKEVEHSLAIKEKDFEIKHLADERVLEAEGKVAELIKKVAVLEKENEMLGKITDLNADVIDVKKLVSDLIGKLPEIKITSLGNGNAN